MPRDRGLTASTARTCGRLPSTRSRPPRARSTRTSRSTLRPARPERCLGRGRRDHPDQAHRAQERPDARWVGRWRWHEQRLRVPVTGREEQRSASHLLSTDHTTSDQPAVHVADLRPGQRGPRRADPDRSAITGTVTFDDALEGSHSDPDLDPMSARNIEVWLKAGGASAWPMPAALQAASSEETPTGRFSVPLSLAITSLKSGVQYEWRAQTKDALLLGRILSMARPPDHEFGPSRDRQGSGDGDGYGDASSSGGRSSDPEGDPLAMFHIQMQAASAHTDAAFADLIGPRLEHRRDAPDPGRGRGQGDRPGVRRTAAGLGHLHLSHQGTGRRGTWSPWSYDDWTLSVPFDPEPGLIPLQTQIARNAPVRMALYKMGTDAGPGALIGYHR